jgi:hypothetical protein
MKTIVRHSLRTIISMVLLAFPSASHAQQSQEYSSLDALQTKINEIVTLKHGLEKKHIEMQNVRREYQSDIAKFKDEISNEKLIKRITSFEQARNNKRVINNLALIQRHLAYIDKINKLEETLSQGIEELLYLERKAKADLKIVRVLDNKDELVRKIDNSLKNYAPNAAKYILDSKKLNLTPLKKIWQEMTANEEKSVQQMPVAAGQSQSKQEWNGNKQPGDYGDEIPGAKEAEAGKPSDASSLYQAPENPSENKLTAEGRWFWRSNGIYGYFTLVKDYDSCKKKKKAKKKAKKMSQDSPLVTDCDSYIGHFYHDHKEVHGSQMTYVSVSDDKIQFNYYGNCGLQYWDGKPTISAGSLKIGDGRWKCSTGEAGVFSAERIY